MKSRIEQDHEQYPLFALILPGAQRMRRYRKQRRQGLRSVRILLDETDIDALIRMRLLKEDQRQNVEALQAAVLGLVHRVQEPPGRLRLATSPVSTGSPPIVKTIGIVVVAALAASGDGSPPVAAITAT
jgi:hypothetical protein